MCWEVPERQEKQEVAGSTGPWLTALAAGGGSSKSDAPTHAALSSSHREASGGGQQGQNDLLQIVRLLQQVFHSWQRTWHHLSCYYPTVSSVSLHTVSNLPPFSWRDPLGQWSPWTWHEAIVFQFGWIWRFLLIFKPSCVSSNTTPPVVYRISYDVIGIKIHLSVGRCNPNPKHLLKCC